MIERKRELVRRHGFEPARPHAELTTGPQGGEGGLALAISRRNERLMDGAGLCIANLTPFRGISADPGTVFEAGSVIASGKPLFGCSNAPADCADRVAAALGPLERHGDRLRTADGGTVEDHGWSDDLMIEGAILARGGPSSARAPHPRTPPATWPRSSGACCGRATRSCPDGRRSAGRRDAGTTKAPP